MSSALEIDGRSLSPIREAAQSTTYSRDYITRLAREGKITASYVGRQWFIDVDSLKRYAEHVALEQEVRKEQLRAERKRERQLRAAAEQQHTLHLARVQAVPTRAIAATAAVLCFGLLVGVSTYHVVTPLLSGAIATSESLPSSQTAALAPRAEAVPAVTPVGDQTAAAPLPTVASAAQRPLGDAAAGVFLLPATGGEVDVPALFSDVVEVRRAPNGTAMVVPVDAAGEQIGREVPFVVVPVTGSDQDNI